MDFLIRWSLRNRASVVVVATLLVIVGVQSTLRLPVDVFPDLTAPTVTIVTEAHGMAPRDLENLVTFPIETAVNGARGVRRVRSMTTVGISVVWVEFDWDTGNIDARRVVNERLTLAVPSLPDNIDPPFMAPVTSIMGEILFLALTSTNHNPMELRTLADTTLRRRLLSVAGVAQVTTIGGEVKQYQVKLSPERLKAHSLTVDDVAEALVESNQNASAGFTASAGSRYLVTGWGRLLDIDDIGNATVRSVGTIPIRVRDLGEVVIGGAPKVGAGSLRGRPAVILGIQKQPKANTPRLTARIDDVLDEIENDLPEGMAIDRNIFRQRDFIDAAVRNVYHALRDGSLLVVLIMALFLANTRATFITLTAIPLSLCAAILFLEVWGATINTMTLGGMAIAIGALVDDAVIDVENVTRRLRENAARKPEEQRPSFAVVLEACKEIRKSIIFATLIVLLVFVPLFFLGGVEGRLLRPLGVAYTVSIFASLIVALIVTPALCLYLLPSSKSVRTPREPILSRKLKAAYEGILGVTLGRVWAVTIPTLALFIAAVGATFFWGHSFLPDFNEGSLTIHAATVPGTPLADSDVLGRQVELALLTHPEVVSTGRRTGRAEGDEHVMGVETSEIDVALKMQDRSKDELLAAIREDISRIPGVVTSVGQPISHRIDHMLSGTRASLAVKIFGPDLYTLRLLAARLRDAMSSVDGVVDLAVEPQTDIPTLLVRYDQEALGRHGVRSLHLGHTLEAAYEGWKVSSIFEGEWLVDLVVKIGDSNKPVLEGTRELPVHTRSGARVPLGALADIAKDLEPNVISREQVERKIVVQANVAGRDIGSVVESIREKIGVIIDEHPGYRVEFGGQFESAQEASRLLFILGLVVVAGIGFLLHVAFDSVRDALFVMLNLPLALIGAVAGVFLSGGVLSVASLIGFITVFGIAARNGIMMISHIRYLQEEEHIKDFPEAVARGSRERLIPILMTALGTALALIPLALGSGKPGSEIQTPMAVVILWGLLSSTILNMIVVPTLYLRFGRPVVGKDERTPA